MILVIFLFVVASITDTGNSIEITSRTNNEIIDVENKKNYLYTQSNAKPELMPEQLVDKSGPKKERAKGEGDEFEDYFRSEVEDDRIDYYNRKPRLDLNGRRKSESSILPYERKNADHQFTEMFKHWNKILSRGFGRNRKEKLLPRMLSPLDFYAMAPKLNQAESVLTDPAKTLHKQLEAVQNQLGAGIAGLADLTLNVIHEDVDKVEIYKKLSRVLHILLDLHHREIINRRRQIMPQLNDKTWNIRKDKARQYLFAENVISARNREKSNSMRVTKKPRQSQQEQQKNMLKILMEKVRRHIIMRSM